MTAALPADPRARTTRLTLVALLVAIAVMVLVSLWWGTGSVKLTPARIWAGWFDDEAERLDAVAAEARTVRVIMATLIGAALASAGALLQTLYRNALASPEITGVTQGSIVAVIAWIIYGPVDDEPVWTLPLVGVVGGMITGLLTYGVSRLGGKVEPLRLILIGVLMGGLLTSSIALLLISTDGVGLDLISWTVGSLQSASWERIRLLAIALAICIPLVIAAIPYGNALALGDEIAQGTGLVVNRARGIVLLAAAALTAAAVSLVGGIGFVGLVAPHLVRGRTGADLRRLLPASALAGAFLVVLADFVSRNLRPQDIARALGFPEQIASVTLPTGVYLALIGAPFFIQLLRKSP